MMTLRLPSALRRLRPWRWRALYFAGVVATTSGLVLGIAAAAVPSIVTGSGTGTVTDGTVSVDVNDPATQVCDYTALVPGDLDGTDACTLSVTYTGSISAWMSLTVEIQSIAGDGGSMLYDGTNTNGLTMSISDGQHDFTVPTGTGSTGGTCPVGYTCWTASNDLAAWYTGSTPNLLFTDGNAVTWTLTPLFPADAGNGFQGATTKVILTAHAVQQPANTLPSGCRVATIGNPCAAAGFFSWS